MTSTVIDIAHRSLEQLDGNVYERSKRCQTDSLKSSRDFLTQGDSGLMEMSYGYRPVGCVQSLFQRTGEGGNLGLRRGRGGGEGLQTGWKSWWSGLIESFWGR